MTTLFKDTVVYEVYGETIAVGDLLYKSTGTGTDSGRTAGSLYKLDVNNKDRDLFYGIAKDSGSAGDANRRVVISGRFDGYTSLTAGTALYADRAVPGAVTAIRPSSKAQFVGIATDADSIVVNAALAGTFGAGGGNTIVEAIAGEDLNAREPVYISVGAADGGRTAGRAYKLQANDDNRIEYVGIVSDSVTAGSTVEIITAGVVEAFSGLTVGVPVYLAPDTAGGITQIDPDDASFFNRWVIRLGIAVAADLVLVNPDQAASAFFQSAVQADIVIANNQSTPADLTSLVFNGETNNNFLVDYTLTRSSSLESYAQTGRLRGVYNTVTNTWFMSDDFTGQNAGVTFSITNLGQIQYTSSDLTGTDYVGLLEYRIAVSGGVAEATVLSQNGDLITREGGATSRLPIGSAGQVLAVTSDGLLRYAERPNDNLVINGNFDFWQRGTSLAAGTGARYLADRFLTYGTGSTVEPSRQTFALGQVDVPNNPEYFHRALVASSAGAGNFALLQTRLEDVTRLSGKTVTLSFWAKADATKSISIELNQVFGTEGSPSSPVLGIGVQKVSLTTSWQKITRTVTLPSVSGKVLGTSGTDATYLLFWFDAGSDYNARTDTLGQQSGTFDIAQVKLEEGSVATPFVLAGGTLAGELAVCQRYYEVHRFLANSYSGIYSGSPDDFLGSGVGFKVQKRTNPVMSYEHIDGNQYWVIPGTSAFSANTATGISFSSNISEFSLLQPRTAGDNTPTSGNYYVYEASFFARADAEL